MLTSLSAAAIVLHICIYPPYQHDKSERVRTAACSSYCTCDHLYVSLSLHQLLFRLLSLVFPSDSSFHKCHVLIHSLILNNKSKQESKPAADYRRTEITSYAIQVYSTTAIDRSTTTAAKTKTSMCGIKHCVERMQYAALAIKV
jgi:hypothetical protein